MTNKVFLLKKDELAPGEVRKVEIGDIPVAVYNLEGEYYATNDVCTHATASLAEGEIVNDDCISCPVHFGEFHIPSGQAVTFPCTVDLRTYKVIVEDEEVFADLDEEADDAASAI